MMAEVSARTHEGYGGHLLRHIDDDLVDITRYFRLRSAAVDRGEVSVRDGIVHLASTDRLHVGLEARSRGNLADIVGLLGAIASEDLSTAFSAWSHRMVLEYVYAASNQFRADVDLVEQLRSADVLGSTALASACTHVLCAEPLPLTYTEGKGCIYLSGTVRWASNLDHPFVIACAAANALDPEKKLIILVRGSTPGVDVQSGVPLMALEATHSASVLFDRVEVGNHWIISDDFEGFITSVLPTFLVLQSALGRGLTQRSLDEVQGRAGELFLQVLGSSLDDLWRRFDTLTARINELTQPIARNNATRRALLSHRLAWADIAFEAVALELKAAGSRGYVRQSGTARRLREAAFFPVQSPTEVQLRWALQH